MEERKPAPPYAPFKTFLSAIENLEHGIPNQIDRSVWPSYSGAIQGQLLAALKFLGLIDERGRPQPDLHELVEKKELRKRKLASILEKAYPDMFRLNLAKVSPKQLNDAIAAYGISGATHRKALAFLLKAARYAELPLSPLLKRKTRDASIPRRRKNGIAATRKTDAAGEQASIPQVLHALQGESKTVQLKTGGSLTLTLSVKLFEMGNEDRNFVFDLLDRMRAYEQNSKRASE